MIDELNELWLTGRLAALHPLHTPEPSDQLLNDWIHSAERSYRNHIPSGAPEINLVAAQWAVKQFYRASQLLVYRSLGDALVESGLDEFPIPQLEVQNSSDSDWTELARVHYSVDLFFRFLPDLLRLAKTASPEDVLSRRLMKWCEVWPLSGARVHRGKVKLDELEAILRCRCLRLIFMERIFGCRDLPEVDIKQWKALNDKYEWSCVER